MAPKAAPPAAGRTAVAKPPPKAPQPKVAGATAHARPHAAQAKPAAAGQAPKSAATGHAPKPAATGQAPKPAATGQAPKSTAPEPQAKSVAGAPAATGAAGSSQAAPQPAATVAEPAETLPQGWEQEVAPNGKAYYVNADTGERTYTHPSVAVEKAKVAHIIQQEIATLKPSSDDFYRQLSDLVQRQDPDFPAQIEGKAPTRQLDAVDSAHGRSYFACPCCARLFHAFQEGGKIFAVVARGQLAEHARVRFLAENATRSPAA